MKTKNAPHNNHHLNPISLSKSLRRLTTKGIFLIAAFAGAAFAPSTSKAAPTIYTIGDSTVQVYTAGYYPRTGWGQILQYFIDPSKAVVVDKAVGGTSSKSYYDSFWAPVRDGLKAGDYVTIQFGINDAATDTARHTVAATTFKDYLTLFVNETKAKGAFPVLVSTLNRNAWNADRTHVLGPLVIRD